MIRRRSLATKNNPTSISGTVRVDARTKRLIGRLQPGEIALINHEDLDRVAAEALVERRVRAVINAAPSSTGRYPNLGPLVLATSKIPLIDDAGFDVMQSLSEGDRVDIRYGEVLRDGAVVAKGNVIDLEEAEAQLDEAKKSISKALEEFTENTLEYMNSEREILLDAIHLPKVRADFAGRHVLVVARGYRFKKDLSSIRSSGYIRDFRPILIGVDGGTDALIEAGLKPDMIIGDMDSVSTEALVCGAELVLHGYQDGHAPGKERLDALGLEYVTFVSPGTSEDIAFLMAHEKGAELIVAVGSRASLIEMMDKGRKGMASTFLVRLRVGAKLVDAKGVSELHQPGPTRLQLAALVAAAFIAMLLVVAVSGGLQELLAGFAEWAGKLWFGLQRLIR